MCTAAGPGAGLTWAGASGTGPTLCGWTDRVRKSIVNHIRLSRITQGEDEGAIGALIEQESHGTFYNMNEVFLDHVRHYFDYTADLALMREIFPVLKASWRGRTGGCSRTTKAYMKVR